LPQSSRVFCQRFNNIYLKNFPGRMIEKKEAPVETGAEPKLTAYELV
jgi:hypothetical protein